MGLFDKLFGKKQDALPKDHGLPDPQKTPPIPKEVKQPTVKKSAKDIATEKGEPYVAILGLDIDPDNIHQGAFELDWNEKFVANLLRAGYIGKTDSDIVDQWFQNICRHVVMETWEQYEAMNPNPTRYTQSKDIGNGRREVS